MDYLECGRNYKVHIYRKPPVLKITKTASLTMYPHVIWVYMYKCVIVINSRIQNNNAIIFKSYRMFPREIVRKVFYCSRKFKKGVHLEVQQN